MATPPHRVGVTGTTGGSGVSGARRIVAVLAIAAAALGAVTFVNMRPALTDCGSTIMGAPGDATAGGVWLAWAYKDGGGSPWMEHTDASAAPTGEEFWQPHWATALALFVPEWAFAQFTSPTCAWNLTLFSGFVLSGLAMFGLVWWLSGRVLPASFAAFAFAFSPYREMKLQGHVAYVHGQALVLLLLACFLLWRKPTWPRAAAAAGALALCGYTDGYYILLGGAAFATFHLAALAYAAVVERRGWPQLRRHVGMVVASGAMAGVLLAPLALILATQQSDISAAVERPKAELYTFSARPTEFVLPSRFHPVFKHVFADYQVDELHGSNFSEQTLYLGWTVLVLGGLGVAAAVASRRTRATPLHDMDEAGGADDGDGGAGAGSPLTFGFAATVLGAVAAVALVMSAPPTVQVGPLEVPGPSNLIFAVIKFWRVYARMFVLAHAALVVLAALSLALMLRRRSLRTGIAATAVLTAVVAFEFLPIPPPGTWDYGSAPEVYYYLAEQPGRIVAEYPLLPTETEPDHRYLTYQPVHGKRLVNVRNDATRADAMARSLRGLADPNTIPALRAYGVDYVVVHPGLTMAGIPSPPPPPGDLELVRSFRFSDPPTNPDRYHAPFLAAYYDADVYRLRPGPVARLVIAHGEGLHAPEQVAWNSFTWMQARGQMSVVALEPGVGAGRVSFRAGSAGRTPRTLRVEQGGRELWSGTVTDRTLVEFTAAVEQPVTMTASPGAITPQSFDPASPDNRLLAVSIAELSVQPA
jgi:hypothetical protein